MAQRIMQYQAAMQLAQSSPEMYNLPELHRQMLNVLGIEDVQDIIPDTDNVNLLIQLLLYKILLMVNLYKHL